MSIKSRHNKAECTSCGIRVIKPYWHDGDPYCQVCFEVQVDYDNTSIIEEGYQEFRELMKKFKSS